MTYFKEKLCIVQQFCIVHQSCFMNWIINSLLKVTRPRDFMFCFLWPLWKNTSQSVWTHRLYKRLSSLLDFVAGAHASHLHRFWNQPTIFWKGYIDICERKAVHHRIIFQSLSPFCPVLSEPHFFPHRGNHLHLSSLLERFSSEAVGFEIHRINWLLTNVFERKLCLYNISTEYVFSCYYTPSNIHKYLFNTYNVLNLGFITNSVIWACYRKRYTI